MIKKNLLDKLLLQPVESGAGFYTQFIPHKEEWNIKRLHSPLKHMYFKARK